VFLLNYWSLFFVSVQRCRLSHSVCVCVSPFTILSFVFVRPVSFIFVLLRCCICLTLGFARVQEFCCNGTIVEDDELGTILQLQGDQRKNVSSFLVDKGIVKKRLVKIHGF